MTKSDEYIQHCKTTYPNITPTLFSNRYNSLYLSLSNKCSCIPTILLTILDKRQTDKQPTNETKTTHTTNPHIHRILDISFYIGLSILLITREIRSILYIILLALLAVTITASVLLSSNKTVTHHALIKTIILFGTASLSIFKIFYWTGRDTWTHAAWNYLLVQEGWLFAGLTRERTANALPSLPHKILLLRLQCLFSCLPVVSYPYDRRHRRFSLFTDRKLGCLHTLQEV